MDPNSKRSIQPLVIVSGGQTGVDRAALDIALHLGISCGGWCPAGGWAEDMCTAPGLLARYRMLRPTAESDPKIRTRLNVRDSDATVVLTSHLRSPGTEIAIAEARRLDRPHLVAGMHEGSLIARWLGDLEPNSTINIAGPRESESPGCYFVARQSLSRALARVR